MLQSGPREVDLPYIGRVLSIWESEGEGQLITIGNAFFEILFDINFGQFALDSDDMMITVLWYYRPEQTYIGRLNSHHGEMELLSSRHQDDNSANCIIDKCHVLTYSEYCR